MKILITGATGFIGKRLSQRLIEEGHKVVCTGRALWKLEGLAEKAKIIRLDLEERRAIADILKEEKPEVVFHCAALVDNNSLKALRRANVEGTRNILDACLKEGIGRVVYLSSVAVISGNGVSLLTEGLPYKATNNYGTSKIEAEKVAVAYRQKGLRISIIRPPAVYGEGEPHLLPLLVKLIRWRLLPILGDGGQRCHLVCIDNVVDVMMLGLKKEEAFEGSYLVADREALTIAEIVEYMAKVLNVKPPIHIPLPRGLIYILSFLPFIGKRLSLFLRDRVYSIDALRERLDYIPRTPVYEGLKRAALYYSQ